MRSLLFPFLSCLLLPFSVSAQFSLYGGANVSTVSSDYLVGEIQPQLGCQAGVGFQFSNSPITPFYPGIRLGAVRSGYIQEIASSQYAFRLTYIVLTPYVGYAPLKRWSTSVGLAIGGIIRARSRQGAQNIGVAENYRKGDIRLQGEIQWQVYEPLSIYLGYTHGLRNLVKYSSIDELGNFTGTIRDVQHRSIALGVKMNIVSFLSKL